MPCRLLLQRICVVVSKRADCLSESTLVDKTDDSGRFRALVRISYEDGRWYLFWPQHSGAWRPFPHPPRADTIQAVVEALEQAPLHVHWG